MIIIKYAIEPICTGEKAVFLDKLLSTVWCNRPFFFEGKKPSVDIMLMFPVPW